MQIPLSKIARHLSLPCTSELPIQNFQIDSRRISCGSLFFALKGKKSDGHSFLGEAKARGAVAAVVEKGYSGETHGLQLLPAPSVLESLQLLARQELQKRNCRVIGITGSSGKTTTKEWLFSLLSGTLRIGKSPENYNTQLTLPLSILNSRGDEEWLVLEMGMSNPGELTQLISIAPPTIALLTGVALAHASSFPGGWREIAREKATIFSSPRLSCAFYPKELDLSPEITTAIRTKSITFSAEKKEADYFLSPQGLFLNGIHSYTLPISFQEPHLRQNLALAIAVAMELGVLWENISEKIPMLEQIAGRGNRWEKEGILYIDESYNANPASMRAAFIAASSLQVSGRRIALLGSMLSLGSFSEKCHKELGELAICHFDCLFGIGEELAPLIETFGKSNKETALFSSHEELAAHVRTLKKPGDLILVKGSRSMEMERLFPLLAKTL
ncbi:MAG: UDP-N-acetylmuramoyl-tripeptide--D-alanyl-D-alanine ligase [Verrucomicrobiota bacterium]|nr:UDP-N-acetylmuramoyl-tripeptide--D-alanyl-D-alanine ligase [Verrucomicrobiota bacterium]